MTTPSAEDIPDAWVKAAEGGYSMHGAGLIRNILAAAAPHIAAAERERIRQLAIQHNAIYRPGGITTPPHPFAELLTERTTP